MGEFGSLGGVELGVGEERFFLETICKLKLDYTSKLL